MEMSARTMTRGEIMSIPGAGLGCRVVCLSGVLWVTREDDTGDYIVCTDEACALPGGGLIVIEAVSDAAVRITPLSRGETHVHRG